MMIAVTGASGEIGARLVQNLHFAGRAVRALLRRPSPRLARWGDIPTAVADLGDRAALRQAVAGADAVIHCAVDKDTSLPDAALVKRNVVACENLLAACAEAGVRRVVHVSSISVLPPRLRQEALAEPTHYSTER